MMTIRYMKRHTSVLRSQYRTFVEAWLGNRYTAVTIMLFGLVVVLGASEDLQAEVSVDVAKRINAANALLRQGDVEKALETYQQIAPTTAEHDKLNYNLAVAHYRQGDFDAAAKLFAASASSRDTTVALRSRYNLGNCHFASALKSAAQNRPLAIEELKQAIAHYRSALRENPENTDARANIELANELLRKLEQEEEQQQDPEQAPKNNTKNNTKKNQNQDQQDPGEQSQGQQNSQQDSQDANSQQSNQQGSESQPSNRESQPDAEQQKSSDADQQPQPATDEEKAKSSQEQSDSKQSKPSESNDSQGEEIEQPKASQESPKNSSSNQPSEQQPQDKRQRREQQESAQSVGEPDPARQQPTPMGDLSTAKPADENLKAEQAASESVQPKNTLMTREEAMKMLQSVRDRDMLRRLQLERQQRSRRITVDKDW